jgi:hypothetical protein
MKYLAFLSLTMATLIAPIQAQAQRYDPYRHCVRFPDIPNPEAELRYMLSHPGIRVCPAANPDLAGQAATVQRGINQGYYNTMDMIRAQRGY